MLEGDDVLMEGGAVVEVSPSAREMHLRILLPPGYKWIPGGAHSVEVGSTNEDVLHVPPWTRPDLAFDWHIPIEPRTEGRADVTVRGMLFFCPVSDESVCLMDMLDVKLPVLVEEGGEQVLDVEHTVTPS